MAIALSVFGVAFLVMGAVGLFTTIPARLVPAGAAWFCGLVLLGMGQLLARVGKAK